MQVKAQSMARNLAAWWTKRSRIQKIGMIAAFAVVIYLIVHHTDPLAHATVTTVEKQNLEKTVLASGTVTSSTDLVLSFQATDIVNSVRVSVGQKVKQGQILATLTSGEENAAVAQARGKLLAAQAAYHKVLEGTSNEEITLAQVQLDTTKKVQDGLVENAHRKLLSADLVAEPQDPDAAINTPIIGGTYTGGPGEYFLRVDLLNNDKRIVVNGLEATTASISSITPQPLGKYGLTILFPNETDFSNGSEWKIEVPNTTGASYVSNLNAYDAAVENRDATVAQAQAALDLKKATARQSDVDAALANVITAQAALDEANAVLEKKIIRAPADGTITKIDIAVGKLAQTNQSAITLQDVDHLYVEALVNESDVSLVAIDQPVTITYDAFGPDKQFSAKVSSIDLAPTVDQGVVNYKIKTLIDTADSIKPGMTANLTIHTASRTNVLVIPLRAVTVANNTQTVQVLTDERRGKTQLRTITTGLVGDGDLVEVTSGLSEEEKVVTFPKT